MLFFHFDILTHQLFILLLTRVNKLQYVMEEVLKLKQIVKNAIKFFIIVSIASLPFISVTNIIGLNAFLDSFENPKYYLCIQNNDNFLDSNTDGQYIIVQKSSHPEFSVENNDYILYYSNDGEITCNKVYEISAVHTSKFYKVTEDGYSYGESIYENQVLGKIVKIVDNNIWNSISLKIWETSIHSINLRTFLENN